MILRIKTIAAICLASWATAAAGANARGAEDDARQTAAIAGPAGAPLQRAARVEDYRPIFQACHDATGDTRLAIRAMRIDGRAMLLTVDPSTLATRLDSAQRLTCADTDDAAQEDTRFMRAVEAPSQHAVSMPPPHADVEMNAGLSHGQGDGSFITGDLCPSRRPLDRAFLKKLEALGPATPVALSISGLWLTRHEADFAWLQEEDRTGALRIIWVNHSYHHPYAPGRSPATDFLLRPGVDMQAEILETERLLIANGATPSVFFRFPDLVSNKALTEAVRRDHLVTLGADGWLVFGLPLRPGAILLVHANGNEPAGLRLFSKLFDQGRLPRPFRPIDDAP